MPQLQTKCKLLLEIVCAQGNQQATSQAHGLADSSNSPRSMLKPQRRCQEIRHSIYSGMEIWNLVVHPGKLIPVVANLQQTLQYSSKTGRILT